MKLDHGPRSRLDLVFLLDRQYGDSRLVEPVDVKIECIGIILRKLCRLGYALLKDAAKHRLKVINLAEQKRLVDSKISLVFPIPTRIDTNCSPSILEVSTRI